MATFSRRINTTPPHTHQRVEPDQQRAHARKVTFHRGFSDLVTSDIAEIAKPLCRDADLPARLHPAQIRSAALPQRKVEV